MTAFQVVEYLRRAATADLIHESKETIRTDRISGQPEPMASGYQAQWGKLSDQPRRDWARENPAGKIQETHGISGRMPRSSQGVAEPMKE
jgi:hypothetical protein